MTAPNIEYGMLGPILIVLGAALIGVLIEAFASRLYRYVLQVGTSFAGVTLAFLQLILIRNSSSKVAVNAMSIDGVAIVLQGSVLIFGFLGLLLIAERGFQSFTAQAAAIPGSNEEQKALVSGLQQTEVFPLTVPVGVTVKGLSLRAVTIQPTTGTNTNNAFLLDGETTVADLTVTNFYQGYATYPYYDRDSSLTLVSMSKISGENLITVANGEIPEKSQFKLSKEFDYFGKIAILSSNEGIILNGSARLKHNCDYDKSWLQFQDTVIAKNIQLPISEQPINSIGQKMAIGFLWHDNENIDSLSIYPAFISKKLGTDDIKLFSISGYIEYNQLANEFQIASKSRLAKSDSLSNLFSLNIKTCQVNAYGDIDLGINLGDLKIE
jgi:hypothetical protein